ncbi:Putative AMP-dependent synthetase/ligase domain, phosphopantetheine binding ACP domain, AMP-binding [Colletotrichum destructivum]|uniref:AMP-dependent synthetase/ligase domain, phosphopantetheine binding ACP domain, AMP-binding n=1 Tax=Colletotrichum destructivum TaxID=34406 RepID=A0AAX4J190_9PEZI|nr:Putative AMP-dependent synthetase/ligase domain, phosphopantetheine binding ACP domain, AMP-binding [Colletotrichum destructivum]
MAPIATLDLKPSLASTILDPMVFPSSSADKRLRELWYMHGEPHSTKFSNPKLTSVAALVEHNAATQPSQPAFIYPVGNSFDILDWAQVHQLSCKASEYYREQFQRQLDIANDIGKQPTFALLGTGSSIAYLITQIALNRLRVRTLLLSNKNSTETRNHLLKVCNAVAIIVDEANEASLRGDDDGCELPVTQLVGLNELQRRSGIDGKTLVAYETNDEWNLHSMIIHSSGSTGVPKPIIHTNRSLCQIGRMYRLMPEYFIENWYLCFPLFHIAGLSIALSGIPNGLPTTLPPEKWPPAPSAILSAWKTLDSLGYPADCLHCAPSVIEDLVEYISLTTKDFTPFTRLKVLQPGGAPLLPTTLSKLQSLGVNIKTTYGTTETGPPFRTIPHTRENPDVYRFRNLYPESPFVRMEPVGEGLFECVVYKGFPLAAELWLDDDAPNPYRTGDLFLEEPPASGYFVLQGRRDDILVHSNGEKSHAAALAMALEEDKTSVVKKTAVFGTGKPCPSVVVEVDWDRVDSQRLGKNLEEAVWSSVSCVNEKSPMYSRIPRQLMLILERGETLPVTPKGNVRRNIAWGLFGHRVEDLYDRFLGKSETVPCLTDGPIDEGGSSTMQTVQEVVADTFGVMVEEVKPDRNWYELGLDSLKAVEIRSKLVRSFGNFPLMFVFEYPTAEGLFNFLRRSGDATFSANGMINKERHEWIKSTIQRLNSEVDHWAQSTGSTAECNDGEVVYLTGASGSLGNALLEVLVQLSSVKAVYCAVRGTDPQARVVESLRARGYPEEIYQSDKIRGIGYDMTDERLGVDQQTYQKLADEVTVVMHNAWKLDFNQPVQQFEADCLRGTMSLMSFCLKGKKKTLSFMSSVAAAMGSPAGTVVPELPLGPDPANALATGYAQSKFIVEQLTQHYASSHNVPVRVLRVGQLCGHTRLGTWNHTEMWPIMMMTGLDFLSAMPVLKTEVDWLPVDVCAEAIQEAVLTSREASYTVTNLTNPDTISWDELLETLEEASGRQFERLAMREWVARLEAKSNGSTGANQTPAMKLLGFFQAMAEGGGNGEGVTFKTRADSGRHVDVAMVRGWLDSWRQEGKLV